MNRPLDEAKTGLSRPNQLRVVLTMMISVWNW